MDQNFDSEAFEKIKSVKQLQRYAVHDSMPHPTTGQPIPKRRNYLTLRENSIVKLDEGMKVEERERLQIFGFVLAGERWSRFFGQLNPIL